MTDDLKERMKSKTCDGGYYADWWQEALDRIEQLEAALQYATEYAGRLASTLAEKHYQDQYGFQLLPSLIGRIDQIDNMTCGMTRDTLAGEND